MLTPDIAAELATLLTKRGWTVRTLRDQGFGTGTAAKLLGQAKGAPSLDVADRALALLGRELWHRKRARK